MLENLTESSDAVVYLLKKKQTPNPLYLYIIYDIKRRKGLNKSLFLTCKQVFYPLRFNPKQVFYPLKFNPKQVFYPLRFNLKTSILPVYMLILCVHACVNTANTLIIYINQYILYPYVLSAT